MIQKCMPAPVRASVICLLVLGSVACQSAKVAKPARPAAESKSIRQAPPDIGSSLQASPDTVSFSQATPATAGLQQPPPEQVSNKQPETARLQLCQQELEALRTINQPQHQRYKRGFDQLMSGASQYAGLRNKVNGDTQEMVDALYNYKVKRLCAAVDQAVLAGLADRAERVK